MASAEQADNYHYTPLRFSREIRLLEVGPGNKGEGIKCSLIPIYLSTNHSYQALSYTWGSAETPCSILVSGKPLAITENLYVALQHFRYSHQPRVLWVDAVCIDQSNHQERSAQVKIMRDIYARAKEVLIWLGEEVETDHLAVNLISSFQDAVAAKQFSMYVDDRVAMQRIFGPPFSPQWAALSQLLQRPWFQRVWIIQEITVASVPRIVCGALEIEWEPLAQLVSYICANGLQIYLSLETRNLPHGVNSIRSVTTLRKQRGNLAGPGLSLPLLIMVMRAQSATEPRDHIYGFHGLTIAPRRNALHHRLLATLGYRGDVRDLGIKIDYSVTAEALFKEVAVQTLMRYRLVAILSFAGSQMEGSKLSLPSWIPDWSYDFTKQQPSHFVNSLALYRPFQAGGDRKPHLYISGDGNILNISGFIVDTIAQVGKPHLIPKPLSAAVGWARFWEVREAEVKHYRECDDIAATVRAKWQEEEFEEAYWRLLICNLAHLDQIKPPTPEFKKGFEVMRYVVANHESLKCQQLDGIDTELVNHPMGLHYFNALSTWSQGRVFSATTNDLLGWVPKGAAKDDVICIFFGADVPYVLRPDGPDHYRLIGESYIHGVMEGEAITKKSFLKQNFSIR